MSRSVLVTGGYGLLGGAVVRACLDRGDRVTVLRRDEDPASALVSDGVEPHCTVVHGDLLAAGLVERAVGEHEVDTVFHLAAQTIVGTARRSPAGTFETNVRGTWLVLEACRVLGVERVVVASSDKAYGPPLELPYREDQPLRPRAPYEASKAAADLIARSYWTEYGVPVAVTRCANLYGGGDLNASRLVPEAVGAALAGRRPVLRSDGSPERDFLYVEDAARANVALADALDDPAAGVRGEAFNAGADRPHAVRDVVALVFRLAGVDLGPEVRGVGVPEGEIDRQWVDSSRLRDATGWAPRVGLEEGLGLTLDWYRAHPTALSGP